MGKRQDVETGVGGTFYYHAPPLPPMYPPPPEPHLSWMVPFIFVVDVILFILTMYDNNCPATFEYPHECLFQEELGRFSFLPFSQNRLIGPSSTTLQRLGGLRVELVVEHGEWWRLLSCLWLHAGLIHLVANMISLLFIGIRLEEEFGWWKILPVYVLSGFGGSLMSCLHALGTGKIGVVSVGASGALFGLLGAMLSELITNWSIYANKCSSFASLVTIVALNLAVGFIPGVDSSAHIGGFISGFMLGFVFLVRPQYGYVSRKYLASAQNRRSKYKWYQYALFLFGLASLVVGFGFGLMKVLEPTALAHL